MEKDKRKMEIRKVRENIVIFIIFLFNRNAFIIDHSLSNSET